MEIWLKSLKDILHLLAARPESDIGFVVTSVVAAITIVLVLIKTGKAFRFAMPEMWRAVLVFLVGLSVCLIAAAATNIYLVPKLASSTLKIALPIIAAIVACLAVPVPLSCFLFKSKYFSSLFSILLSLAAAFAIVMLAKGAVNAFSHGKSGFSKTGGRTKSVNETLGK